MQKTSYSGSDKILATGKNRITLDYEDFKWKYDLKEIEFNMFVNG